MTESLCQMPWGNDGGWPWLCSRKRPCPDHDQPTTVGEALRLAARSMNCMDDAEVLTAMAAELDTAPAPVYQLPAEPPDTVTELVDRDGCRWERKRWPFQPDGSPAEPGTVSWMWERNGLGERQRWPGLLAYGPLSTTPPNAPEGDKLRVKVQRGGTIHQLTLTTTPPAGTEAGDG